MPVVTALDFETLFRDEYPRLVAFGVSMTGDMEVARDLAQETMARAHRHWSTIEAADAPAAWLRRVMRNLITDHHRHQQVERNAVTRLRNRPVREQDHRVEPSMAEMLAVLPERQRAVVALYYVDDRSVAEIADALSMAPGTVKSSLWKARRTLKRHQERNDSEGRHD